MTDKNPQSEMNKLLFTNLVSMLGSSAMQQMGKLVNPITGKTELNLEGSQVTIDMIAMIQEKTKGNLDNDEQKIIDELLSMLQMNFVETSSNPPSPEPEKKEDEKTNKEEEKADASKDSKDPKFHKSYGENESNKEK